MPENCRQRSVVKTHDSETLYERGASVACGNSFVEIIGEDSVGKTYAAARMLKASYTPVVISRKTVFELIRRRYATQSYKRLVTHKHSVGKTAEGELFGSRQMPCTEIAAIVVYNICLSVYNARPGVFGDCLCYDCERIGRVQLVAGIKKNQIIA